MTTYKVVEIFKSINGEGYRAGQLALFIRFAGCNLNCSYCDTAWANASDAPYTEMTIEDIVSKVIDSGIKNITLTGGEPLIQDGMHELLARLSTLMIHPQSGLIIDPSQGKGGYPDPVLYKPVSIEIETNGTVDIVPFINDSAFDNILFTVDYKLASSGMESQMFSDNYVHVRDIDTVKFVAGSQADLRKARIIIETYKLPGRTHVYLSPIFGKIEPEELVEFLIDNNLNDVNVQLQMHKIIWDPDKRGV